MSFWKPAATLLSERRCSMVVMETSTEITLMSRRYHLTKCNTFIEILITRAKTNLKNWFRKFPWKSRESINFRWSPTKRLTVACPKNKYSTKHNQLPLSFMHAGVWVDKHFYNKANVNWDIYTQKWNLYHMKNSKLFSEKPFNRELLHELKKRNSLTRKR